MKKGKGNPEEAAAEMFESFHGLPSHEVVEFVEEEHYHGHLSELGMLVEMKVVTLSGYKAVLEFEVHDMENPKERRKKGKTGPIKSTLKTVGGVGGYLVDQADGVLSGVVGNPDFSLYEKAKEADDRFQDALEKAYGKRAGDMRYQSSKHTPEIKALAKKKHAADAAWLKEMRKGNPERESSRTVLLCTSEDGKQLYLVGGDQKLDLNKIHMDGDWERDSMVIGDVTHITYHTRKVFGGKEEEYDYFHKFSEDSKGPLPMLRYDTKNERLYLDGGSYKINKPMMGTSPGIED